MFALPIATVDPARPPERLTGSGLLMVVTVLGVSAATWGVLMAVSPLLQIRQMWRRQSSQDVSIGFFLVLLPGFALWVAYGMARSDWALVVPNLVALLVGVVTVTVATLLRRRLPAAAGARAPELAAG